jgi:hypothetical protein
MQEAMLGAIELIQKAVEIGSENRPRPLTGVERGLLQDAKYALRVLAHDE